MRGFNFMDTAVKQPPSNSGSRWDGGMLVVGVPGTAFVDDRFFFNAL
jgi:hypothetical protein